MPKKENLVHLGCDHTFCSRCIQRLIEIQYQNESNIYLHCPICSFQLGDNDIAQIDPKYVAIFDDRFKKSIIGESSETIVYCPSCHEGFLYEPGQAAYITSDSEGGKARPEALECLRLYRASCTCGKDFCANCGAVPYHQGFTCEENKLLAENIICRFCRKNPAVGGRGLDACRRVCWDDECKRQLEGSCMHVCECGHACCGLRDEREHFGCPICHPELDQCAFCNDECSLSPSVRMRCGHPAHKGCLQFTYQSLAEHGKIDLPKCNYMYGQCGEIPYHECVRDAAQKWIDVAKKIEGITVIKMKEESIEDEKEHVNNPDCQEFYKQPLRYAKHLFEFYFCDACHEPYYGGHENCQQILNNNNNNAAGEYRCLRCRREFLHDKCCRKHGEKEMTFKCFFCCNESLYCCGGTTYYCKRCHDVGIPSPLPQCDGKCAFAPHPPNGQRTICGFCMRCEYEKEQELNKK
ncbi:regulation of axon guidance [Tritrichomonas musculus]|uniref:Regulation of axon guidance n=1 Tax=Tritrichomonas musculus TaxID=1915356 RepID=A0ABR2H380_9EUKA